VINLEMCTHDAIVLRHTLFMHTKNHPGFFSDKRILKVREISQQLDREIQRAIDEKINVEEKS